MGLLFSPLLVLFFLFCNSPLFWVSVAGLAFIHLGKRITLRLFFVSDFTIINHEISAYKGRLVIEWPVACIEGFTEEIGAV